MKEDHLRDAYWHIHDAIDDVYQGWCDRHEMICDWTGGHECSLCGNIVDEEDDHSSECEYRKTQLALTVALDAVDELFKKLNEAAKA